MPAEIELEQPDLSVIFGDILEQAPDLFGEESVNALMAGASLWPVRTGLSKRSFGYSRVNMDVRITNSARSPRGYPYPVDVEARTGLAERTLRGSINEIVERVDARIEVPDG